MEKIIESCFPYSEVSQLVKRELRVPRPYQLVHSWPGRLPGILFRALILASLLAEDELDLFWRLLKANVKSDAGKGKVFLDPFAGSGTSLVEALSLGMKVIGVDVNSVAWFVARCTLVHAEPSELRRAAEAVVDRLRPFAEKLYATRLNGKQVTAKAFFWVRTIRCERCGSEVKLFKTYKLARVGEKVWAYCPRCHLAFLTDDAGELTCPYCRESLKPVSKGRLYRCPACGHVSAVARAAHRVGKPGMKLFAVMYRNRDKDEVKAADKEDLAKYKEAERLAERVPRNFLKLRLRFGEETSRALSYGYRSVRDLFNARQLVMLYALAEAISELDGEVRNMLALALSKTATFSTVFTPYSYVDRKPESAFALHQYTFERMYMEVNMIEGIRGSFLNNVARLIKAKKYTRKLLNYVTISSSTGSADATLLLSPAQELKLPHGSVDLVVTDPPHFGNVVNSGIADFHYAVLKPLLERDFAEFRGARSCRDEDELIFDPKRGKGVEPYRAGLTKSFFQAGTALKPEGLLVVVYRHSSAEAWSIIYSALEDAGFELVKKWPLDLENYPQPQARSGGAKSAVLVCRKP